MAAALDAVNDDEGDRKHKRRKKVIVVKPAVPWLTYAARDDESAADEVEDEAREGGAP